MKLSERELVKVLSVVSPTGTHYQAGRICQYLAKGPQRTGFVAQSCSVGNISDVVATNINPKIAHLGLYIAAVKPPVVIKNKFGQVAGDWVWGFYRINKAANDPVYDQGSSADDWEQELKEHGVCDA